MGVKKPLVLTSGQVEQVQSADYVPGFIKQTEIDFGATPIRELSFTITDADIISTSRIIAILSYEAPTGKDQDELEMDDLSIKCSPGTGDFTMYVRALDDALVHDKFKINYMIS